MSEQFEQVCKPEFEEINRKLDQLDEAIRGNGKPGIQIRLDRLENAEAKRGRIVWLIVGVAMALVARSVWGQIFGS